MQFLCALLDIAFATFSYPDTFAPFDRRTKSPNALHSNESISIVAQFHPWISSMLEKFDFLQMLWCFFIELIDWDGWCKLVMEKKKKKLFFYVYFEKWCMISWINAFLKSWTWWMLKFSLLLSLEPTIMRRGKEKERKIKTSSITH